VSYSTSLITVSSDALHSVEFVTFNPLIQQLTSAIGLQRSFAKRRSTSLRLKPGAK
jgi:hypothetical protein